MATHIQKGSLNGGHMLQMLPVLISSVGTEYQGLRGAAQAVAACLPTATKRSWDEIPWSLWCTGDVDD